ncbi:MAG TPA: ATP-binding cassette domain-containing protein, partial [Polyangiaceae bacterium]|nr:ATP-binding cassette domain-containing protein [Polyangiaceae bacterium]
MSLLIAQRIGFSHGSSTLLTDASFSIEAADRVGIVGRNGSGKSTLLNLLLGSIEPDTGTLIRQKALRVEAVPQFLPDGIAPLSVYDAIARNAATPGLAHENERILDLLEFSRDDWQKPVGSLSGGWVNRLLLGRALIAGPELILLDEPTNHMDLAGILFFEQLVNGHLPCAIALVSHDRTVLDACTSRTLFVRDRTVHAFSSAYSEARALLLAQDEAALRARQAEQHEIDRLQRSANRLLHWARNVKSQKLRNRARTLERRIERIEGDRTAVSTESARGVSVQTRES